MGGAEMEFSDMELVLAGDVDALNMIELGGQEVQEEDVLEAIKQGHDWIKVACEMQQELKEQAGKPVAWEAPAKNEKLWSVVRERCYEEFKKRKSIVGKLERNEAVSNLYAEVLDEISPKDAENPEFDRGDAWNIMHEIESEVVTEMVLQNGTRSDGRGARDIRDVSGEVGVLPRTHGSAIF